MNHHGDLQLPAAPSYLEGQELGSRGSQEANEFLASPSSLNLSCLCNITSRQAGEMPRPGAEPRAEECVTLWTWLFKGRTSEFTPEGQLDGNETVRVEMVVVWWWRGSNIWEGEKVACVCVCVFVLQSTKRKRKKGRVTKN